MDRDGTGLEQRGLVGQSVRVRRVALERRPEHPPGLPCGSAPMPAVAVDRSRDRSPSIRFSVSATGRPGSPPVLGGGSDDIAHEVRRDERPSAVVQTDPAAGRRSSSAQPTATEPGVGPTLHRRPRPAATRRRGPGGPFRGGHDTIPLDLVTAASAATSGGGRPATGTGGLSVRPSGRRPAATTMASATGAPAAGPRGAAALNRVAAGRRSSCRPRSGARASRTRPRRGRCAARRPPRRSSSRRRGTRRPARPPCPPG